jgi:hypothetical protein
MGREQRSAKSADTAIKREALLLQKVDLTGAPFHWGIVACAG